MRDTPFRANRVASLLSKMFNLAIKWKIRPDNPAKGLPTITASYMLVDTATGATVALLDGTEITRRRTAAASALVYTAACSVF